ncbi:MAG: 30S ribosome-binding factor RbfA [Thermosulfidibacteraceae bacterium]|jgi:ribosome-binding factor A
MRSYKRTERLNEVIREEIAELICSGTIKDERLRLVTITKVRVSDDLSYADVYYSVFDSSWETTRVALEESRRFIEYRIMKDLRIKKVPKLRFVEDRSMEYADRIERLLREMGFE